MKRIVLTTALVASFALSGLAQTSSPTSSSPSTATPDTTSPGNNRPLIDQQTKDNVKEKTQEVKQDIKEKAQEVKEKAREEVNQAVSYQQRNQLSWFQPGSIFVGGSLGFGVGAGSGTYLALNPRVGYFFQPGLAAGIRFGFDKRINTSYRANQTGLFLRYYPFRTRISGFGGIGYNFGREYSSNIGKDEKATYNSINLELGVMFLLTRYLGGELSLENNYYDKSDPLAGRNKGGRLKLGVNYYFGRANR